jgi:GrpB-like predicted nucleotidyltransferase (UPF0157 family)
VVVVAAPGTAMSTLDEPISLSEYQANWPAAFAAERQRLVAALGIPAERIEHIGSTAVPGLLAKPVVDLMLGVMSFPGPESLHGAIERIGYEPLGEAGVVGRLYYRQRAGTATNLHVVAYGGDHWSRYLALRDFLRASEPARQRYATAKLRAIDGGATSLLAYSAAKADLVEALLGDALSWKGRN